MSSPSPQLSTSTRMGLYEPLHQVNTWTNAFIGHGNPGSGASPTLKADSTLDNKPDYVSNESAEPIASDDQETNKIVDKVIKTRVQRRLAQNRKAARKSRLRKKVYVQQLETSRLKLAQLEQELERVRHQDAYFGCGIDNTQFGLSGTLNPGIAVFEMEYSHWVDEQHRQNSKLRIALQAHITDMELHILVDTCLNHYYNLFQMKADAAKLDVFYLMSGVWRTPAERFLLWIGGFRPSELLNVIMPYFEPLNDQQLLDIRNLRLSSQQAEDALSQGMEKLQQTLVQNIVHFPVCVESSYSSPMADDTPEKLEALESFVNQPSVCCSFLEQADHLRQQTLQQMSRILTTNQAARGLLALGDYFDRLRALSSLWAARPRDLPIQQC